MSTVNEQGQTCLAQRTKGRKDTCRLLESSVLNEVFDNKIVALEVGATPIVLTLASAVRCVGCVIEGVVTASTDQASLTIGGAVVGQLQFTGAPRLTSSLSTLAGAALTLPNVAAGTRFRAVSTGARWHVVVNNPSAQPFANTRAISQSTSLGADDANTLLAITVGGGLTLTLPAANTMVGAVIRGVIVAANTQTMVITGTTPSQLVGNIVFRRNTSLADTVQTFTGQLSLAPNAGTSFEAVSTGTNWVITLAGQV